MSCPSTASTRSPGSTSPYAGAPWHTSTTRIWAGSACTAYPSRVSATYLASFCDWSISSVLNAWFCASLRHPTTSLRFSTSRSGSSHDVTTRHTFGSRVDTRTVRKRTFPAWGYVWAPSICTTDESSGVAEPGEMITYGRWIRNPAITITATSTPRLPRTHASTGWRRPGVGSGSSGGGGGGGPVPVICSVMRLRSGMDNLGGHAPIHQPRARPRHPEEPRSCRVHPPLSLPRRRSRSARARARTRSARAAHRGMALARMVFLVGVTGFIVAAVVASVFAGIVIAINGRLP